jgi:CheY-like chemotaxis protein
MAQKLLLADDSVTIQRVIELTFADEDIQVVAVGDGKQAIDRLQSEHPDIVLADVGMPERDGYEVAAYVKSDPRLSHIPVLLLTGAFEPIDESRAREVGCDGVLVKPFEPQMVISRVKDLLSARRASETAVPSTGAQTTPPAAVPSAGSASLKPAPATAGTQAAASDSLDDYFDRLDAAFSALTGPTAPEAPLSQPAAASAAFREAAPPPAAPLRAPDPLDALATWDPELTGDPARDTNAAFPPPFAQATPSAPWESAPVEPAPARPPQEQPARPPAAPSTVGPELGRAAPPSGVSAAPAAAIPSPAAPEPPAPSPVSAKVQLAEAFAALLAAEQGHPVSPSAFSLQDLPDSTLDEIVRRVLDRMSQENVRRTVVDVAERLVREEIERIKNG